jgi:hypothetical protein
MGEIKNGPLTSRLQEDSVQPLGDEPAVPALRREEPAAVAALQSVLGQEATDLGKAGTYYSYSF